MNRFARDSRKWNVRVLLSSQIPADFLRIQGFVALLDSVFVGRLDDDQAQEDALRLLTVPVGAGYEQVVASLGRRPGAVREAVRDTEPRQFIFGDGAGGVERIRIDLSGPHLDHLRAVMDTTPDALREAAPGAVLPPEVHGLEPLWRTRPNLATCARLLELADTDAELARVDHRRRTLPEFAEIAEGRKAVQARRDGKVANETTLGDLDREVKRQEKTRSACRSWIAPRS